MGEEGRIRLITCGSGPGERRTRMFLGRAAQLETVGCKKMGKMNTPRAIADLQKQLEDLWSSLPRKECAFCDCLQGFLTQLGIDFGEAISEATQRLEVRRADLHRCLGCDPCPPAEAFSDYIRTCRTECAHDRCKQI